ncbi:hypothetical protein HPB52_003356 [Rhipicephalus sanguineus]|uniref:Uncharacterized protein n=1 Tax=Rhipicephalus sanguineus TaxID=34632 RepID=A0A9D4SMX7_RHISA|nr:hypothetical protein HPB52_003356 [Rhipicephalus sanguineus]
MLANEFCKQVPSNESLFLLLRMRSFDLEDGPGGSGGGRALLEASSPSGAGLVLSNFPPQRRESFLYRSDSEFEMSPKSVSRHSSIGSEA